MNDKDTMSDWSIFYKKSIYEIRPSLSKSPNKLFEGESEGFKYAILHNNNGYRCGYICIPENHPWYKKQYQECKQKDGDYIDVHGGLTYCQLCDDGWWIGFDCAHLCDAQDSSLPHTFKMEFHDLTATIKSNAYVEYECKKLCKQAKEIQ
jgi:hypothetical protein